VLTQEVLVTFVLLCDAPWNKRLSLLFDLFKCSGVDELNHEDLQLAAQVAAAALFKLWRVEAHQIWDVDQMQSLTEGIADNAYLKLSMEYEEPLVKEKFVTWGLERFRESRTIATHQALLSLFESAY